MHLHSLEIRSAPALHTVCGEFTVQNAAYCKETLLPLPAAGSHAFDLSGVTVIDGAGVQLLMLAMQEAATHGVELELIAPSPAVRAALATARLAYPVAP